MNTKGFWNSKKLYAEAIIFFGSLILFILERLETYEYYNWGGNISTIISLLTPIFIVLLLILVIYHFFERKQFSDTIKSLNETHDKKKRIITDNVRMKKRRMHISSKKRIDNIEKQHKIELEDKDNYFMDKINANEEEINKLKGMLPTAKDIEIYYKGITTTSRFSKQMIFEFDILNMTPDELVPIKASGSLHYSDGEKIDDFYWKGDATSKENIERFGRIKRYSWSDYKIRMPIKKDFDFNNPITITGELVFRHGGDEKPIPHDISSSMVRTSSTFYVLHGVIDRGTMATIEGFKIA